jgi:hypothetical protein
MKKIKFIILLCALYNATGVLAQNEKITIVLLKGNAVIENSGSRVFLQKSERITIVKNATVKLTPNSAAIAYTKKVKLEFGGAKELKTTFLELNSSLNKLKPESLTSSFIAYLDRIYIDIEEKNNSFGGSIGAASRGYQDNSLNYFPNDESIILSDSLLLRFGDEATILGSNIVITNESNDEVVYNDIPLANELKLVGLKPGNYYWTYGIELNGKKIQFKNTFLVPADADKQIKLKEISDFKASITNCKDCFNEETKTILLNDFLESNRFYLK